MSASLIEKMRAARESWAEVGGKSYKVRRPTDLEMMRAREGSNVPIGLEMLTKVVVGWKGVTEADLVPSGASDEVEFSPELWAEYVADRTEIWQPITEKLLELTEQHQKRQESELKN